MTTLYRGEHFVVRYHRASLYVHLLRTEVAFASVAQVESEVQECERATRGVEASTCSILLDWTRSVMSLDPELHASVIKHCNAFAAPFRRRAVLIATPVGHMQASRIARVHSDVTHEIFRDMNEAVAYLTAK